MTPEIAIDVLIAVLLVGMGAAVLLVRDLVFAVMMFIAWGLLLALAWVRLSAPDVALAEAALGAGLTGALLLGALRSLKGREGA